MGKNKFFAVNMDTVEENKPVVNNQGMNSKTSTDYNTSSHRRGIKFNQQDLEKKLNTPKNVVRIENSDELFGTKKEKMSPKDLKYVLVPGIILILFSVLNMIFLIPKVIENTKYYVLDGVVNVSSSGVSLNNSQLLIYAGMLVIIAYCIFSIILAVFSIYNIFRRVYVKKDLIDISVKIMMYSFLIGVLIVVADIVLPFNLSKVIVKITTLGLHSL